MLFAGSARASNGLAPAQDYVATRTAAEGGQRVSLTWINIRDVHAADLAEHATRAQALGLDCPLDVFEQLFHEHHDDAEIASLLVS